MHAKYTERGLSILAFPSNQFGHQEPGTNSQIKEFANSYNAQFDMFSKIDVNGDSAHPLWKWLKEQPNGKGIFGNGIKWNFTKFLINREGQVVKRYSPLSDPSLITPYTLRGKAVYVFVILAVVIGCQRSRSEDSSRGIEWKRRLKRRPACLRPGMGVRYPGQQHPRTRGRRTAWTRVTNNLGLIRKKVSRKTSVHAISSD
nr:glutathione peroxidase [Cyprinus carpio]